MRNRMPFLKLTENLRKKLKTPLGKLTSFDKISKNKKIKNKIVICVGDRTSELALSHGLMVKICIYDSTISRKKIQVPDIINNFVADKIHIKNPAGYLNLETGDIIKSGIKKKNNLKIIVDGEEDLTTLAAIDAAPENSIVLYGQPGEGVVMVVVEDKIKAEVRDILENMERS